MSVITDLEAEFEKLVTEIEAKTADELRKLYADALAFEAKVKVEIVLLRQRAANLASDAEAEAELLVLKGKELLVKAVAWIKQLETKLFGTSTVKDFNTGEQH
jgi:hypothetical protein